MIATFATIVLCLVGLFLLGALISTRVPYDGCVKLGDAMALYGRC